MHRSVAFTEDNDATVRPPLPTLVSGSEHNEHSGSNRPDSKVKGKTDLFLSFLCFFFRCVCTDFVT